MSVENQAGPLDLAGPIPNVAASAADAPTRWGLIAFGYYFVIVAFCGIRLDRIFPDHISVTFLGHYFSVGHIHHHIVAAGSFGLVAVPAAFALELAIVRWPNSSLRHLLVDPSASCRSDFVVFLLWQTHVMNFCKVLLTFGAALLSGVWLHDRLMELTGIDLTLLDLPAPIAYSGYFLLFTFLDYWTHRLDHTRYLWPLHRYHHAAQDFYILTSDRGHPGSFTGTIVTTLPLGLLNVPPAVAFWIYIVVGVEHLLVHSRIDTDLGWIGRYIVQSPVHHRLHHALDATKPTAHFSLIPLWDHLFGTWQGGGSQRIAIGVADPYRHGIWVVPDLWRDYREFLAGILQRRPADSPPLPRTGSRPIPG